MRNEKDLFAACRLLFGEEIEISWEFLGYLKEEGIAGAFRKKALEYHPDRARLSGLSKIEAQNAFFRLQNACQVLRQHLSTLHAQSQPDIVLPEQQLLFGRFLCHTGIVDSRQIVQALAWQKSGRLKIGELAVKLGYLERNSINIILNYSRGKSRFGLIAWELGLLHKDEIQKLLNYQRRQQKKIGQFFVEQGVINRVELEVLLAKCKQHNKQVQSITNRGKRMKTNERRKNTRVLFNTTVDLTFNDASYPDCTTENLSTRGVFVDNIPNRVLGDSCHITLKLQGSSEGLTLSMNGKVARLTKGGVGLHFTDIDLDSYSYLRKIVYYNSNDTDTTEETL